MDAKREDWEAGFEAALKSFMEEHGALMEKGESKEIIESVGRGDFYYHTYGLLPYAWRSHRDLAGCSIVASDESVVQEFSASEFVDTFSDNDEFQLVVMTHASCTCGKWSDRVAQWRGSLGEIARHFGKSK